MSKVHNKLLYRTEIKAKKKLKIEKAKIKKSIKVKVFASNRSECTNRVGQGNVNSWASRKLLRFAQMLVQ